MMKRKMLLLMLAMTVYGYAQKTVKVLIPSPAAYASRLEKALVEVSDSAVNFKPVCLPMITTTTAIDTEEFNTFFAQLADYDYVAFCSRRAIDAYASKLSQQGLTAPSSVGHIAIGSDNDWLTSRLGIQPAFLAKESSPMGIVRVLRQMPGISGKRIAVLAPKVVGMPEPDVVPTFVDSLKAIGMRTDRIHAYTTTAADEATRRSLLELLEKKAVDCIAFTSGTEATVIRSIIANEGLLEDVQVVCFGPYTAAHVKGQGMEVSFVSPEFHSFQAFARHLHQFFAESSNLPPPPFSGFLLSCCVLVLSQLPQPVSLWKSHFS